MADIFNGIKRTVKNISKPFLVRMIKFALNHPRAAMIMKKILCYFPSFEVRLRRLYYNKFLFQTTSTAQESTTFTSQDHTDRLMLPMTTHAKHIYEKLKREIVQRDEAV